MMETLIQDRLESNASEETVSETSELPRGVILLEGGKQQTRYSTDHEPLFRQESYFHWAFGVADSDVYGAISLPSGEATLFVPRYGITYEIFCGSNPELDDLKSKYGVENVLPLDDLDSFLKSELDNKNELFLLQGPNSDSGNLAKPATFDGIQDYDAHINKDTLFQAMTELRVRKTQPEIELMKYTNHISSMAHVEVMRNCKPGMMEYQLESLFQHHTYYHGGCRIVSYTSICATGSNPSILHYGYSGKPNDKLIEDGDMALLDMGAEYHCYASDITCSFPVNGKFTEDQLVVYNAVLDAQLGVIQLMRPGVSWLKMHKVAETAILKALQKGGLVKSDSDIEEMIDADLGAVFMPHGLGHLIGIDTHDVGGYMDGITPTRSKRPGKDKLRTARNLEEGMVITLEPGCYFVDILLDQALADPNQAKFLNSDRIKDFRGFGGVRLEENVAITEDGCQDLTTCPRAVSEVIDVMSGKPWPPTKDVLPELKRNWAVRNDDGKIVPTDLS